MPNTVYPPPAPIGPSAPSPLQKPEELHGSVGQDKNTQLRERAASSQPFTHVAAARSHPRSTKSPRSQKQSSKRKTVPVMLWVSPSVKAEIQRRAETEQLSISKVGGFLLEDAIRQSIHSQYASLIQPIIEQTITRQMRVMATKLTILLVRIAFDSGQTRSLVTNILGRQPGVTPAVLNDILDGSSKTAKSNIYKKTPQIASLIEATEKWLKEEEKPNVNG